MKTAAELCKEYEDLHWNEFWRLVYEGAFYPCNFVRQGGLKESPIAIFKRAEDYTSYEYMYNSQWFMLNNDKYLNKLKELGYKVEKYDTKVEVYAEREVDSIEKLTYTYTTGCLWWRKRKSHTEQKPIKIKEAYKKEITVNCLKISACCNQGDK